MAETPRCIEVPAGSPLGQILRDGITTAGDIREGDLIVYANPPASPSVGEPQTPAELWRKVQATPILDIGQGQSPLVDQEFVRSYIEQTDALDAIATAAGCTDWNELPDIVACVSALRSSLEEARKDSERLDWLERAGSYVSRYNVEFEGMNPHWETHIQGENGEYYGRTARAAIDDAMRIRTDE